MYLGFGTLGDTFPSSHPLFPNLPPLHNGSSITPSPMVMTFVQNTWFFRSRISTSCSSYDKSSQTRSGLCSSVWAGSLMYFYNIDTWNTLWTCDNSGGMANSLATTPTCFKISKGLINLGLNFPFFPNLMTPLDGDTLKNAWSPTWNSRSFLILSALGKRSHSQIIWSFFVVI